MGSRDTARVTGSDLRAFVLRFLVVATVLGLVVVGGATTLASGVLPLFKTELAVLDDTFRIDALYVDQDGADQVFRINVGLARTVSLNGRTFRPDPRGRATASTLVGHLTLPCVLLIASAFAWPVRSRRQLALRLLLLLPGLLLLCLLGVPFILWAALWGLVVQVADPHGFSLLLTYGDFLQGGGHFAIALALGLYVGTRTAAA